MNSFNCLRLSILAKAKDQIQLPDYKGATLRGSFGYALRRSVCVIKNQNCSDCMLKHKCVYSYAFETPIPENTEMFLNQPFVPHPFILNPITDKTGIYKPGSNLRFGMTLIGRALEYLPYFIYAFMQMGEAGIGKGRGRFTVEQIDALDSIGKPVETIYQNEILKPAQSIINFNHAKKLAKTYNSDKVSIKFLTPVRIKYKGRFCKNLQFHIIVRNLLRRISSLLYFHCNQKPKLAFGQLIKKAESVSLNYDKTFWYDWIRYSGRQKKRMKMGGLMGEVQYKGNLEEFLPLLVLGSWVNIGKGTSFGLGSFILKSRLG
ncbi:conserved hypothetical protein [Candidatus Magnetomoraceae bacterium gMMP-15]